MMLGSMMLWVLSDIGTTPRPQAFRDVVSLQMVPVLQCRQILRAVGANMHDVMQKHAVGDDSVTIRLRFPVTGQTPRRAARYRRPSTRIITAPQAARTSARAQARRGGDHSAPRSNSIASNGAARTVVSPWWIRTSRQRLVSGSREYTSRRLSIGSSNHA